MPPGTLAEVGRTGDILAGRSVSTGSVFSTILISTVIGRSAPEGSASLLIDVGSGDSPYRRVVAHERYVGIDRRPTGEDALLVIGDAQSLPLADGVADALLCTEVIEHVPDEHALAAELARIAAPGASLVLSAPFVHGLHEQPYDFRRLTSLGLVRALEGAGWHVETISSIGGPVVVAVDGVVRWIDSQLRRVARRLGPAGSRRFALLVLPSAALQRALAAGVLAGGWNLGPIDPMEPSPRLTLGYVVRAARPV